MADEILSRRSTHTGSKTKGTWSFWIKRNIFNGSATSTYMFYAYDGGNGEALRFNDDDGGDSLRAFFWDSNSNGGSFINYDKLRDPSAWQHIMCVYDSTLNTADNMSNNDQTLERVKIYVNGRRMIETGGTAGQNPGVPANHLLDHWGNAGIVNSLFGVDTAANNTQLQVMDHFFVDGQALTPDVFGFNKDGDGYYAAGHKYATDYRSGQWRPRLPKSIKHTINRGGGFGTNGYYLPLNDSSNPGADFHCTPNTIIKLKGEDESQPRNGVPTTSDSFVSQLREEKGSEDLPFEGVVRFGGDGTSSAVIFPHDADLDLGGSPFTAECWIYPQDTSGSNYGALFNKGFGFQVYWKDDIEALQLYVSGDGSNYNVINGVTSQNGSVPKGRWTHIAVVREPGNNTWKMFTNGKLTYGPLVVSGSVHSNTTNWAIGDYLPAPGNYEFKGFVSNFRLVVGNALYTAAFTPPTTRLENIANTKLLCCQSATSATEAAVSPTTGTTSGGTETYATKNEMTGSIVLAIPFISHPIGSNLLTVGTFDNAAAWTPSDVAAPTISGGKAIWDGTSGTGLLQRAETPAVITTGNKYIVKFTMTRAAGTLQVRVGNSGYTDTFTENGTHTVNIVAGSTPTETILFYGNSFDGTVDDVEIYLQDTIRDYSADIRGSGTNKTVNVLGTADVAECPSHYGSALVTATGAGNYVEVAANAEFAYLYDMDHTIEFWYKNDTWDGSYLPHDSLIGLKDGTDVAWRFAFTDKNTSEDGIQLFGSNGFSTGAQTLNNDWNHCAVEQYTSAGATKTTVYINGVASGQSNGPVGYDAHKDSTGPIIIGTDPRSANLGDTYSFRGEIQDVRIYKGIAKYKGGFDVAKPYTPKQDADVGIDSWRTTPDTVTNNFPTWNNLQSSMPLTQGNLTCTGSSASQESYSTVGITSGKWYVEARTNSGTYNHFGLRASSLAEYDSTYRLIARDDGNVYGDSSQGQVATLSDNYSQVGDIVAMAINGDDGEVTFYINGVNVGGPYSIYQYGSTPTPYKIYNLVNSGDSLTVNFGQNPSFCGTETAGTNTDSNGKGLFKYLPPSGYLALCTDNLPTPAIADPGKHFKTVIYDGDSTIGRKFNVGFKPDLVWIKCRSDAKWFAIVDSVRGNTSTLFSNSANAASAETHVSSFDSDGFTIDDIDSGTANETGMTYAAWAWKAGGRAYTNNDGSVSSTVSVNQDAGFSIVKFTGQTSGDITVGHGLGKKPGFWIYKPINTGTDWYTYHQSLGASAWIKLDGAEATTGNNAAWGIEPTDTVLTHASGLVNQGECIMYVWTEIEGYSSIGSYIGNQDDDGPFVYCGFKPAFVLLKLATGDGRDWHIYDSARNSVNPVGLNLRPSSTSVENDEPGIDFLANGFKIRKNYIFSNKDNSTIVYVAFAESPFKTANAK